MQSKQAGVLRSNPLLCTGAELVVSADALPGSSKSSLCVALVGADVLELGDCVPVPLGDKGATDYPVRWPRGGAGLAGKVGKTVVIEFRLMHATIYTFGFQDSGAAQLKSDDGGTQPWSDERTFALAGLVEPRSLPAGLAIVAGSVAKHSKPLLVQDQPWEFRLDNGYPNVVYNPGDPLGDWRLWYHSHVR